MRLRNVVAVVLAAAPIAACGTGDDEPAAEADAAQPATDDARGGAGGGAGGDDADDQGSTAEPGPESGSSSGAGSDRPPSVRGDYPVPFPSGWEVDLLDEIGMTETSGAQLLYSLDSVDDVVAFYDEWFETQPEEYARSVQGEGFVVFQQLGETLYQVTVANDYEERGESHVALQVSGDDTTN